MDWQPIETAPKNMVEVLVFDPSNEPQVFTASYIDGWSASVEDRYAPRDDYFGDAEKHPTHWMPLPDPPPTRDTQPQSKPQPTLQESP